VFLKTKKSLSLNPPLLKKEDNADAKKKALFCVVVVWVLLFLDKDSAALSMHNTKSFSDDRPKSFGRSEKGGKLF